MPSAHRGARVDSREVRSRHPLNIRVRCRCRCAPLPVGRTEKAGLHWLPFSTAVQESQISLVPGERIELPTNGLQNRCSTAELTRLLQRVQSFSYSLRGGKGLIGTDLAPTGSAISRRSHASTPAAASACSVGTKAA
jgi:hypothetical protein